jgi:methionine synthase II (cobalamin-independent)
MDVDFDLKTSFNPKDVFPSIIRASIVNSNKELAPHACGYYLQNIAVDPDTGLAAIPYDKAEELGYEKIDFLHLSILDQIQKNEHIDALVNTEPNWNMMSDPSGYY